MKTVCVSESCGIRKDFIRLVFLRRRKKNNLKKKKKEGRKEEKQTIYI